MKGNEQLRILPTARQSMFYGVHNLKLVPALDPALMDIFLSGSAEAGRIIDDLAAFETVFEIATRAVLR